MKSILYAENWIIRWKQFCGLEHTGCAVWNGNVNSKFSEGTRNIFLTSYQENFWQPYKILCELVHSIGQKLLFLEMSVINPVSMWAGARTKVMDMINGIKRRKTIHSVILTFDGILAIYYHCPLDFTLCSLGKVIRIWSFWPKESQVWVSI